MIVTVYVNWGEERVMSEKEYKEEIERRAKKDAENEVSFMEWLEENYNALEMFNMEGKQKTEVREAFFKDMMEQEEDGGFGSNCEEFTFEI